MTLDSSIKEIITLTPSIVIASLMLLSLILWFAFFGIIERVEMRKWRNMNTQGKNSLKGRLVRVGDNSDKIGIRVNKNVPLRRSPIRFKGWMYCEHNADECPEVTLGPRAAPPPSVTSPRSKGTKAVDHERG